MKEFTKRDASYQYLKNYICKMDLQFIVREPENITPQTQLLVMLHGYGSNEEDLFSFRHDLPKDWIIVSFRAPRNSDYEGFAWYDIDFNNPDKFLDVDQAVDSMKLIMKSIDNLKHHYQLESKTNIVGFSQGGVLTYAMTLTYPDYFHKVACLSSYPDPKILKNIKFDDNCTVEFNSRFVNLNNDYINPTVYKDFILGKYIMFGKEIEEGFLTVNFENGDSVKKKSEDAQLGEIAINAKNSPFIWKDTLFLIYEDAEIF